jgi:proteasome lid subunit RPN8/RPN11
MFRRIRKPTALRITQKAHDKILMWSFASTEVAFLLSGKGDLIEDAFRLINYSHAPKNELIICPKEQRRAALRIVQEGREVIAIGHSHPHPLHRLSPSRADIEYFPRRLVHLLALPCRNEILAFWIRDSVVETKKARLDLIKAI